MDNQESSFNYTYSAREQEEIRRIREGTLQLGDLPKGKWRHLTKEETDRLRENT